MCDEVLWLRSGEGRPTRAIPKRVVDAYLTYVAGGEEALLAREPASTASTGERGRAGHARCEDAARQGYREGPLGQPRSGDHGRAPARRPRATSATSTCPGRRLTIALVRAGGRSRGGLRVRGGPLHRGRRVRLRHQHPLEDFVPRARRGRRARCASASTTCAWWREPTCSTSPSHRRDGTPYDYHRGLYSFRVKSRIKDVGVYRPRPPLGVRGRRRARRPAPAPELDLHDERTPPEPYERAGTRATALSGILMILGPRHAAPRSAAAGAPPGRRVVFTNGCFDLLHAGHVRAAGGRRARKATSWSWA